MYVKCSTCGGSGTLNMSGRFEDARICCDGGVYLCDECECEFDPDDTDGGYHLCDDCLSQRPFFLDLDQANKEGWTLEVDDKFCEEPPLYISTTNTNVHFNDDEGALNWVYEKAINDSSYHGRAILLTMGFNNDQIDKLYEHRTASNKTS